ncbi:uncharacterized protein LOC114356314 isoform X1 [Ostrinia furnacalis]|uniref:uncharacterized protein LOC114356314 isoform X1 n=1 Tax=Ostrinia furnacalis TaxID=93504 RepID=UPI001040D90F|nr:uncharacterized protein LOC114356314 isoform X1 [Ostrinia furnacalis]XP_028165213.1 uncharacterized protein LOC114356314 isoform X1 [Ostrinia furnacalis]
MRQFAAFILTTALVSQCYAAPQWITFNDGKLGVNFGGYHAAVGIGGILGQNGSSSGSGLFAEAGTPYGQAAHAGFGGSMNSDGRPVGGLFAGATAGNKITAQAGIGGAVNGNKVQGNGFASAQAGNQFASSGLGGDASGAGANGFTYSGTNSFLGGAKGKVDTVEVKPLPDQTNVKKVHKEFKFDSANEVNFVPLAADKPSVEEQTPVVVKEVSYLFQPTNYRTGSYFNNYLDSVMNIRFRMPQVEYRLQTQWRRPQLNSIYRSPQTTYVQTPPQVVEKHVYKHTKPRHHLRKIAYVGGDVAVAQPQPAIQKRIDVGVEANAGAAADVGASGNAGQVYTKQVTFQRNPNFFADIFNIPISTLKAVGNFLGNAAGSTNVSVQKSASIHTADDSDLISAKHEVPSSLSTSAAHVSVETPNVSRVIDDILAIPINTLGAVNKFLENNVPAKKSVQVSENGTARVRRGPHGRRRGNKVVIVEQETTKSETAESH